MQSLRQSTDTLSDVFTYTMGDTAGATSTTTLTVSIHGANDAPTLAVQTVSQNAIVGSAFSLVLPAGTFTDVDAGDTLSYTATAADGSLLPTWLGFDAATRTFSGTPTAADVGTLGVKVSATDLGGLAASETFNIAVATPANTAPTAVADAADATEKGGIGNGSGGSPATGNVLTNDTDPDAGDTKTVTAVSFGAVAGTLGTALAGAHGSLVLETSGDFTYTVNETDAAVQSLRQSTDTLSDVFTYTMGDTAGATSTTTLTVSIHGANDAPTLAVQTVSQNAIVGSAFSLVLPAGTFTDVDAGDTLSYTATAADGSLLPTWLGFDAATRTFSGTPTAADVGTLGVKVSATDLGGLAASETFNIAVATPANTAPTAVADAADATEKGGIGNGSGGSPATGNVLTNDTDPDAGDTQTVTAVSFGAVAGTLGTALAGAHGSLVLETSGDFTYTVNETDAAVQSLRQSTDTLSDVFTYTMGDTAGATSTTTLTVSIHGANDAPTLAVQTVSQNAIVGSAFSLVLPAGTFTDVDAGDTLSYTATAADGSLLPTWLGFDAATRTFSGTPTAADVGTLGVKVSATDLGGLAASETFNIAVATPANTAPTAVADAADATEKGGIANGSGGSPATGNVLTNDTDPDAGDTKTVTAVSFGAVAGTLGTALAGAHGSLVLDAAGDFTYTVNETDAAVQALRQSTDTLSDVFTYTMGDTAGATSTTTLTVSIHGVNDAPTAVADTADATEKGGIANGSGGSPATGNVLTNDTDPDAGDTKTVTAVSFGAVAGTLGTALAGAHGSLVLEASGDFTYTVNETDAAVQSLRQSTDTLSDVFTYTMGDTAGATSTTTLTVSIHGANDAPTLAVQTVSQNAIVGSAFSLVLPAGTFTDVDAGDTLSYTATAADGSLLPTWLAFDAATRTFSGTPTAADVGTLGVKVSATDLGGLAASETFNIAVATAPTTVSLFSASSTPAQLNNNDGTPLEVGVKFHSSVAGEITALKFYRSPSDTGSDLLDLWTATGTKLASATFTNTAASGWQTVTLATSVAISANTTYVASYHTTGAYVATTNFFITAVTSDVLTAPSTTTAGGNGVYAYGGISTTGIFPTSTWNAANYWADVVFVATANTAPTAVADTADATEKGGIANGSGGSPATGNVLTNDTDPDAGDTKTVTAVSFGAVAGTLGTALAGAHGSLVLEASGDFTYTVNETDAAVQSLRQSTDTLSDVFTYTMGDTAGATSTTTLTVSIHGANDAPTLAVQTVSQNAIVGSAFSLVLPAGTFTDVDAGDTLSYTATAADGSLLPTWLAFDAATRTFSGTPTPADVGTLGVKVSATDLGGLAASETFNIAVVTPADTAPTAVADTADATERGGIANGSGGSPATGNVLTNDTDPDAGDTKTVTAVSFGAVAGTLGTALAGAHGSLVLGASGDFTYTVNETDAAVQSLRQSTDTLSDVFSYTMRDTAGATSTTTLTVSIHGANDAPTLAVQTGSENATVGSTFSLVLPAGTFTDVDAGDTLSYTATAADGSPLPAWLAFDAATRTFSGTPTATDVGTLGVEVLATDLGGLAASETFNIAVATAPTTVSLFSASSTPAQLNNNDGAPLEVGVKFQSSVAGEITALKFYRSPSDTGSDVLDLWTATGTKLASATFTDTAASGWQTMTLATPVAISADTTYVASYHTTGAYVATTNFFTTAVTSGVLTAPSTTTAGGNGVYAYGGTSDTGIFPTNTYGANNYWADVAFKPQLVG